MACWQYRLKIADEWKTTQQNETTPQDLARVVATKLRALPIYQSDEVLQELVDEFEGFADDPGADANDFDDVLDRLYDWADEPVTPGMKRCWIATF